MKFNLRRQLILVSLLLLSLPWAGCQFIREMEGALRHGQAQGLQATAEAVAAVVGQQQKLIYPDPARIDAGDDPRPTVYALPSLQRVPVDGYAEGWEDIPVTTLTDQNLGNRLAVKYRAVTRGNSLYLLIQVEDPEVVYHNPGLSPEPNGDRLVLRTWQAGKRQEYVLATAAPGSLRARAASRRMRGTDPGRIRGYWQDARGGYNLELEIPLAFTGERLGFYIVNASAVAAAPFETLGNVGPMDSSAPPWLIHTSDALQTALAPFAQAARSIEVTDNQRWRVGELGSTSSRNSDSDTFWLLRWIYRSILSERNLPTPPVADKPGKLPQPSVAPALAGKAANWRYREPGSSTRTILAAVAPIRHEDQVIGTVVVSQSGEQYLSLTDQAFSRLLGYSLLAIGLGALGLLGYASFLSLRIQRLSEAARKVVAPDGSIAGDFPRSRARDEIGELSRHYAELLERLREYNDYLRTLSRKLSHELRTPIAVIQTSLENLEHSPGEERDTYLERARGGLERLNSILTAMSEATRLEESIRNNRIRAFDLVPLLREVHAAYSAVYSQSPIELILDEERAPVPGVPELIVQALDKVIDNAVSFSTAQAPVTLSLRRGEIGWEIAVRNSGPHLSPGLENNLFDPMISQRSGADYEVHLGLGLHVARLISDYHQGRISATNVNDPDGVQVTMELPAA